MSSRLHRLSSAAAIAAMLVVSVPAFAQSDDVFYLTIDELLSPDREALKRLIAKQD